MPEPRTRAKLDNDRRDLLDLTLRNPLLNFRARSRSVTIVGEAPAQVYQVLVKEGKRLSFLPAPGPPAESESESESDGLLAQPEEPERPAVSQIDLKLQTTLPSDQLQTKLLAIFHAARTSLEEQGVNTLFLALGMLAWREADAPEKVLRAPLVLVPVELERSNARERFRIKYSEDDLGVNLSLTEKLKSGFAIAFPELPDAEELETGAYFDAVAATIAGQPDWSVEREAIVLGFFSFGKFLMYRDLDEELWPEGARPSEQPIVRALLQDGFHEPPPSIGDDDDLDSRLAPGEPRQIVDADSSQTLALVDVIAGRNLVIQGPPGTGKSQTITNLIASAVGRGKTVLFVAEKMAALEVVKRRLDSVGLGAACLELHSHKTRKKDVLDELRRTLALARPRGGALDDDLKRLGELRDDLNAYCAAINTPVGPSGVTPHEAIGEWLRLRVGPSADHPPAWDVPELPTWSGADFQRRLALVEQLQARLAAAGVPKEHPFHGSRRLVLLPTETDKLRGLLAAAKIAALTLKETSARLARALRLPLPTTRVETETLVRAAGHAEVAGQLKGAKVHLEEWQTRSHDVQELLDAGQRLAALRARYGPLLISDAWNFDLLETRQALQTIGRRSWIVRFCSGGFRRARRQAALLFRDAPPKGWEPLLEAVNAVQEAKEARKVVIHHDLLAALLFGGHWRRERSDWEMLGKLRAWAEQLQEEVHARRLPRDLLLFLSSNPDVSGLGPSAAAAQSALDAQRDAVQALTTFLEFGAPPDGLDFARLDERLDLWSRRIDTLAALASYNQAAELCRKNGCAGAVAVADSWPDAGRELTRAFRRHWYSELLSISFRDRPALATFDGAGHDLTVGSFCALDRLVLRKARVLIADAHWQKLPKGDGGGQLAVLRREFEKKIRHIPLRQLMERAGIAVQAIKPVFMMSPLSVASYLKPGILTFDLIVFDEASQVRPVDAFGALLRGKQAVVVGDSRQLPPTRFFDRLIGDDEDESEEEASGDVESILGLFVAQGAPERMLRWHYRSRHESLIAVSNHEFYDDRLVVFPSPDAARRDAGLVFRHLPETSYDRGKTRTNPGEAEAVALAVMEHARAQLARPEPDRLTLGVAAFSMAQMQAIQDRVEWHRRSDPSCEGFFGLNVPEPFFVKNLENVQGDERDVIFISVGYGRTEDGSLSMGFGPLNGDGGERRLNVLISRARLRCEVFTNLTDADIDLERTAARGVRAFKTFLAYARTGTLDANTPRAGGPVSAFETAVRDALTAQGTTVQPQIGSSASCIDLAVVDPDQPGRYLLGIECDGPSYQSARSARDRDRLRRQVLDGLGWQLERTWSANWLRDPDGALQHLRDAVTAARESKPVMKPPAPPAIPTVPEPVEESEEEPADTDIPEPRPEGIAAYEQAALEIKLGGQELYSVPKTRLAGWVATVVAVESPVHPVEVARRIGEAVGTKRIGARIQSAVDAAAEQAVRKGTIRRQGDFLWRPDMQEPTIRNRGLLPAPARKLEMIAPEEIARALERVVADACAIEPAAVPAAAARLLGFARIGDEMRSRLESLINDLIAAQRLAQQGGHLVLAQPREETV